MKALALLLAFFAVASAVVLPTAQPQCLSFASSKNAATLLARGQRTNLPPILTASNDWPGVHRAAGDLSVDFERTAGVKLPLRNVTSTSVKAGTAIIVGTVGRSTLVDELVKSGKVNVDGITGKWESFVVRHVEKPLPGIDDALVIVGSDKRGTIFGIYTISEQLGVSPWYFWTDTPSVQRTNGVYITKGADCSAGAPTVQYRGIFINDEQPAITNWANARFGGDGSVANPSFTSEFYVLIFEVILRLKANYFWPPVWNSAFGLDDPLDQPLADYYGIVMGTSHQEPMMRSSPVEWNRLGLGTWSFESNPENVTKYFIEGAQRASPYENVFTVGMRGSGDLPLGPTTNIDLLERVIKKQREIISDVFNTTDQTKVPQVWCLYKEVQNYYNMGMRVPDDVTLLWTDDNWGHVQRLPSESERARWGGAGLYFHVDYVGDPMDYKWINTINNAQSYQQLSLAVEYNATRVWILNVGDFKANEIPTEFFLSMAYNASAFNRNNLPDYYTRWAEREFQAPSLAPEISGIVANFSRLTAIRKPELTTPATFSTLNYREADTYNAQWQALAASTEAVARKIPQAAQSAFFETVGHPVAATANLHALYVAAKKNEDLASQASGSANTYAKMVQDMFETDWELREKFHGLEGGKWEHMMDQTHLGYYYWQQPMQDTLPPLRFVRTRAPALAGTMRITVEGSLGGWPGDNRNNCKDGYNCGQPVLATLSPYGPRSRYVDVSPSGPKTFTFTATSLAPWLTVSAPKGTVKPDDTPHRVELGVDWKKFPVDATGVQSGIVTFKSSVGDAVNVTVSAIRTATPAGFHGFVEADGVVSIEAEHFTRNTPVNGVSLAAFPSFGTRAFSGVSHVPGLAPSFSAGSGPSIEYDFYTFNTVQGGNSTAYNVTAYLYSSFNLLADGPCLYGISLDGGAVKSVQPVPNLDPGKFTPPDWNDAVANGVRAIVTSFADVGPGKHTLKVEMITPGVVFEKFVVDVGGLLPSYLGPPESSRV
ncbi:hypothetical protein EXIGLDRAFT_761138 [Exidia glandulosa HHB12029]|uniref:Gylcosyl hydrolase 115 C-terminal domain-containing protein n=1 Tax=Exidia glandulosa HHB12029 TaxID=1314781 RepID=A0A165NRW3_EXIGL|nr:hypothetical protein EXIGLDRAFT_761138 [Exidia glandulosa HHB12029]